MAAIETINVTIHTGDVSNAGTDGTVYLGILGREFRLDSDDDDFERGSVRTYKLGVGANITQKEKNDPRNPQLDTVDLNKNPTNSDPTQNYKFPVYIRLEGDDHWNLVFVNVEVGSTGYGVNFPKGLWLGPQAGRVCFLREGRFGE